MLPEFRIATHPGQVLLAEFLEPLRLTQAELARGGQKGGLGPALESRFGSHCVGQLVADFGIGVTIAVH